MLFSDVNVCQRTRRPLDVIRISSHSER
jgi:hypothetical protein